jgi:DNA repair exonuclease SbcCD nuclease subunit
MSDLFIKKLFIGDNHIDNITPTSRSDNYMEACLSELQESLEIARENKCECVVFLGDIFHRMEVGAWCRNLVLKKLKEDENGKPWPFRKLVCVGNHDIDHNIQNLKKSTLGTLIESGVLEMVDDDNDLGISFGHFRSTLINEIKNGLFKNTICPIIVAHASVVLNPYYGDYVIFDEMPLSDDVKYVIAGHIHFPMESERSDGKIFINPGNVGRERATKENMSRVPQVLLMEHNADFTYSKYQYITLQRSANPENIFRVEEIKDRKSAALDTKTYIQKVSQISNWNDIDDKYESLRISGKIKQLDSEIIELAVTTVKKINEEKMRKKS